MIEPGSPSDFEIERLIRASLDRASDRIDPRPLFDRIKGESRFLPLPLGEGRGEGRRTTAGPRNWLLRSVLGDAMPLTPGPSPRGRGEADRPIAAGEKSRSVSWRWAGLAAAALVLIGIGFPLVRQERKVLAKGETVVRDARQAHLQPIDRCYLVEVRRESSLAAEVAPNLPQVRQTRLWTRGDRFWVESVRPDQRWAWGRDEANRFWIAFGPHAAVRYEADEVPERLSLYCDLHSLNLERWLGDVLNRFDLTRDEDPVGKEASTIRIKAKARDVVPLGQGVQSAELEIDAETRVIRRMVVRRVWNGEPLATVTYSLAETDALDPADYQVEGHLSDPFEIFTRDHDPQRRKDLMARWSGNRPGRLPRPLEPPKRP